MSKVKIEGNASGTGTFTIAAPNSNTDRTFNLPDEAGTVLTSASDLPAANLIGDNPQSFIGARVYPTSNQTVTSNVTTKILFGSESWDQGSYWDASNSKYTPPVGFYFINFSLNWATSVPSGTYFVMYLYKNGSEQFWTRLNPHATGGDVGTNGTFVFRQTNASDYWELYLFHTSSDGNETFETNSGVRSWANWVRLGV
jgi:hypothetical protein